MSKISKSGWLNVFRRITQCGRFRRRPARARDGRGLEPLESRLAMAVDIGFMSPTVGTGVENWLTVVANEGSEVFMQRVATPTQDLFIADNGRFVDRDVIDNVDSKIDSIYVYNGVPVSRAVNYTGGVGVPLGYPWLGGDQAEQELRFLLPSQGIDFTETISGTLNLQDGSSNRILSFANGPDGNFSIVSGPGAGGLLAYRLENSAGLLELVLDGGGLFGSTPGSVRSPELSITYDTDTEVRVVTNANIRQITHTVAASVPLAADPVSSFQILDTSIHKYIPGTLRGSVELGYDGGTTVEWQVDESGYGEITGIPPELWSVPVSFTDARIRDYVIARVDVFNSVGEDFTRDIVITGQFRPVTGVLELQTEFRAGAGGGGNFGGAAGLRAAALTLPDYNLAVRDIDQSNRSDDPLGLSFDDQPNGFTLYAGQTLTRALTVEYPNPLSSIALKSPIVAADATRGLISLAATSVDVMAPARASNAFRVPSGESTRFGAVTESVRVDAVLSSPSVDIRVADDAATGSYDRSQIILTQSGVIGNVIDVLAPPPAVLPRSNQAYFEVADGDIFIEGRVAAVEQSYAMTSDVNSELEAPYVFTTRSRLTGVDTGRIIGETLSVNLANDIFGEDFKAFQTVLNELSISTEVDRVRALAGSRLGHQSAWPFPYTLSIKDSGNLIIDSVAASSGPITVDANGTLDLLATLRSFGDITLESADDFNVNAPILTAFGQISLTGPQVTVANAVQVLDAVPDERTVDIRIEATDGPLVIEDAISGINRVELASIGAAAEISGNARVVADIVEVEADGDIDLRTDANVVTVTATGTVAVDELTAAAFVVRSAPAVTLVANGPDAVISDAAGKQLSPALLADLYDTTTLTVSAPNGSIDVLHYGADQLQLGDGIAIRAFENDPTAEQPVVATAAGSVLVRSEYGREILVNDAARPTSGAEAVRFVTTGVLPGQGATFTPSSLPGIYPTTLTVRLPLSAGNEIAVLDNAIAADIRLGDKVLVKDGLDGYVDGSTNRADPDLVNGIYVIRRLSYPDQGQVELRLSRATSRDSSAELRDRHYVRVVDGGALVDSDERGSVFVSTGFEDIAPGQANATPLIVTPVASQPGFVTATAVATGVLNAAYSEDSNGQTITAADSVAIGSVAELFDGVTLGQGSRVLVRTPVGGKAEAVGLYYVSDPGFDGSDPWVLTRVRGVDEDGDGEPDPVFTGVVAINQGLLRTALTGEMFRVSYDSINHAPISYQKIENFRADADYATADFDPFTRYRLDVGTNNPLGRVTFEVSGEGGTNDAAGSLGKMISLANDNTAVVDRVGVHPYGFVVNTQVNRIDLEQALPQINVPITIDGNDNLTIDGSAITKTADGSLVRGISFGSRVGPVRPSQQATARRLVRNRSEADLTEINGITVGPNAGTVKIGAGGGIALTTSVRNLAIGGFGNGAAVQVLSADNVLVENLEIGRETSGRQLPNKFGVRVLNGTGDQNGRFTTVLDSDIVGSSEAGVQVEGNASGVRIIQSRIGDEGSPNAVGVQFNSDTGHNFLGSVSVAPATGAATIDLTPLSSAGDPVVTIPKTDITERLRPGVEFYEPESKRSWILKQLILATDAGGNEELRATLDGPSFTNAEREDGISAEVGYFTTATARSREIRFHDPAAIVIGQDTEGNDITTDGNRLRDLLFIGQGIAAVESDVFLPGTRIVAIVENGDEIVVELSLPAELSSRTAVIFDAPLRNTVSHNQYGVKLLSGSSHLRNTDVVFSIFDGVRIEGVGKPSDVASGGRHVIGDAGPFGELDEENVAIHSNALTGLVIPEEFFAAIGGSVQEKVQFFGSRVLVSGNYLGTDVDKNDGLTNGLDGESNISFGDTALQEELVDRAGAVFRPEENLNDDPSLVERVGLDRFDNFHVEGEVGDSAGNGFGDGGTVSPPPRRR